MAHRYARFDGDTLLGRKFHGLSEGEFTGLLNRYAIAWVVGCTGETVDTLRRFSDSIEEVASAADCPIFRVRAPQRSRFLEGTGRVTADFDGLQVGDAAGDRIVLKYHWVPNLTTEPPLPIEEAREPGAPVGFIAVRPQGTRDFTIRPRRLFELGRM
jgi:hypothetical protein